MHHPEVGSRSCESCKEWLYDEETGAVKKNARTGMDTKRPPHIPVMCETSKGCPRGTPDDEMRPYNWQCWRHYQMCRATGNWPDDEVVRENAAIISDVEGIVERHQRCRTYRATENLTKVMVAFLKQSNVR